MTNLQEATAKFYEAQERVFSANSRQELIDARTALDYAMGALVEAQLHAAPGWKRIV